MRTRFKLDENLPRDAQALVGDAGHDAETVIDERLGGSTDRKVLDACRSENRILITLDLDFADIRLYRPADYGGIWVLRPVAQSIESTLSMIRGALALLGTEPTAGRLWVVEQGRIRIRE